VGVRLLSHQLQCACQTSQQGQFWTRRGDFELAVHLNPSRL
jgi:hypothetical protein